MHCDLCNMSVKDVAYEFGPKILCFMCNQRMENKREEIKLSRDYIVGTEQMMNKYRQKTISILVRAGRR